MKHSKEKIVKALLLAPLPMLLLSTLFIIFANHEFSLTAMFVVFTGHALVYLAYCVLSLPFTFLISVVLNHYSALNLFTICICSLAIAAPFFIFLGWSHTGELSKEWWTIYNNLFSLLMALVPAIFYWLMLKTLKEQVVSDEMKDKRLPSGNPWD